MALLSTLLVAVLTVRAKVTRQSADAARRLEAVAAADALLTRWWPQREHFPRQSSGDVPGDAGLTWRTMPVRHAQLNDLATSVIRLDVVDARPGPRRGLVLASVDVVLDDEANRENQPDPAGGGRGTSVALSHGGTS